MGQTFMLFNNIKKIGDFFTDPRGTMCVITNGVITGVFWMCSEKVILPKESYRNGFMISGATYELSDDNAKQVYEVLNERI